MNTHKLVILIFNLILIFKNCDSARILCIYSFPSLSHHIVFRQLTNALADRGHELVVVTTDLTTPDGKPHPNVTEIDVHKNYEIFLAMMFQTKPLRGMKFSIENFLSTPYDLYLDMYDNVWEHPDFKKIYEDESEKFDVVIVDALLIAPMAIARRFNASLIWFSTLHGGPENYDLIGAPNKHPFIYPMIYKDKSYDLSAWEKLGQLYLEFRFLRYSQYSNYKEAEYLKKRFGDTLTLDEVKDGVDLLFVNSNPIFEGNRPVPPNVIHLGGNIHLKPVKPIPEDIKSYLDSSTRGVVYVSFGSNIRPSLMDPDLLEAFLKGFGSLPYDVLWKFDSDDIQFNKPANIKFGKWFPQRDMLMHPNIKLFITQAGLQSTFEAIDAAVPLIAIPMLAEQCFNAERYVKLGIGVRLDVVDITEMTLIDAVNTVVKNPSYYESIKKLRGLLNDQPMQGLDRAVWWTEYLIRNGGAKHLRSPQANMSWSKYFELELISLLLSLLVIFLCGLYIVVRNVRRIISRSSDYDKVKKS